MTTDWRTLLAVFGGGALGASARAAILELFPPAPGTWPWATFIANLAGSVLLGYLVTRPSDDLPPSAYRRSFLGTGFCGALTTFSTLQLELVDILDAGRWPLALAYAAASVAGGLLLVAVATAGARRVAAWR